MCSSGRGNLFYTNIKSLYRSCSDSSCVEVCLKVDTKQYKKKCMRILDQFGFKHNVLCSPVTGIENIGKFQNDLAKIASGKIFWILSDDGSVTGDWVKEFLETRDTFKDNIYVIHVQSHPHKIHRNSCPAISREWYDVLGVISPITDSDSWLNWISQKIRRRISKTSIKVLCFPPPSSNGGYTSTSPELIQHYWDKHFTVFKKAVGCTLNFPTYKESWRVDDQTNC